MRRRRSGFTLLELLAVIGIMLILIGIAVVGYRLLDRSASTGATKVALGNAKSMTVEYELTGSLSDLAANNPVDASQLGSVDQSGAGRGPAIMNCQTVIQILQRVPKVKDTLAQVPPKMLVSDRSGGQPLTIPALADAWGNPIIWVPPAGLTKVKIGVDSNGNASQTVTILNPNPTRGFWASAGADGDMSTGDDNVYSFEQ